MVCLVARQGRQLQRYNDHGGRQVVGCIPYRFKSDDDEEDEDAIEIDEAVEVLVISSQKGNAMMFPKGGWESDESEDEAASREALEEAGVQGKLENKLGKWMYKSKRYGTFYEGTMFPLNVTEELSYWPEMESRKRKWVTMAEAREGCRDLWMKEALEVLIQRLSQKRNQFRL